MEMKNKNKKAEREVEIDFGLKKIIINPAKATHFLQKVGQDKRITIPFNNREDLNIQPGDLVETIIIKKHKKED